MENVSRRAFGNALSESAYSKGYFDRMQIIKNKSRSDDVFFPDVMIAVNGLDVDRNDAHDSYTARSPVSLNHVCVACIALISDVDGRPLILVSRDAVCEDHLSENDKSEFSNMNEYSYEFCSKI